MPQKIMNECCPICQNRIEVNNSEVIGRLESLMNAGKSFQQHGLKLLKKDGKITAKTEELSIVLALMLRTVEKIKRFYQGDMETILQSLRSIQDEPLRTASPYRDLLEQP